MKFSASHGMPRRTAQGTAGGLIPEAVLAPQPEHSAVRRAAPSRRDRAILALAGVLRKGARPLRTLPPSGRLVQRQNLSGQRHRICVHDHEGAAFYLPISPANVTVVVFTTTKRIGWNTFL